MDGPLIPKLTCREMTERWHQRQQMVAALLGQRYTMQRRYMETMILPAIFRNGDGKAYVNVPAKAGLRYLGKVEAEGGNRHREVFSSRDTCGWFTDLDGLHNSSGDGLVWGVVYMLPGRSGRTRMVAGYMLGGMDDGPVIDFTKVFVTTRGADEKAIETEAARQAGKYADKLAEAVAEEERNYQWELREEEEKEEAERLRKEEEDDEEEETV